MKKISSLGLLVLLVSANGWTVLLGQVVFQQKDLAFAQVAVGPTIETLITVTNRGTAAYLATVGFRKGEEGEIWNPTVNGQPVTNGQMQISIPPGGVSTFRITGSELTAGAMAIVGDDLVQNNFVEGNLTYFIRSGASIIDSVGVAPSTEFYLASLPFDDFSAVGLALANPDFIDLLPSVVTLRLFSADGTEVASTIFGLRAEAHRARFLNELFPNVSLTAGRLDIRANRPIGGTALKLVENQLSALPLLPSPTVYTVLTAASTGSTSIGEASLWAEGFFVKGYLRITSVDGDPIPNPSFVLISGRLVNRVLRLTFFASGSEYFGREVVFYIVKRDFSFEESFVTGNWLAMFLGTGDVVGGTYQLTKVN